MTSQKIGLKYTIGLYVLLTLCIGNGGLYDLRDIKISPSRSLGADYGHIECLIGEEIVHNHVPAPNFKDQFEKNGGELGDFEVEYNDFTPEAEAAFQYAVDIWDMLLDSDVKINVRATFASLNSGTLGSAAPTAFYENFSDKAEPNIEYAVALAEKIAGQNLNRTEPDLSCNFSNDINWYFDTSNPSGIAANQYDFATVVLHELGHGLGFLSRNASASTSGIGFIRGINPIETDIFSLLLEDGNGDNLTLNYTEATSELGEVLTGRNLYFDSHTVSRNPLPEIFAPNPWNGGSSLSHLDEGAHAGLDALMTPSVGQSEVIHDPSIALTMMYDMGWRSSFIGHQPENRELLNQPVPIVANIYTDNGVGFDSSNVKLIYSTDAFRVMIDTLDMVNVDGTSIFEASFQADGITRNYQYYIALCDTINKGFSSPRIAPDRHHIVTIGIDSEAPVITHNPVQFYFLDEDVPTVSAKVFDGFTGLDSVILSYQINDGPLVNMIMNEVEGDYTRQFNIDGISLVAGDSLRYHITAIDKANSRNMAVLPTEGYFKVQVKDIPDAVEYYFSDFDESNIDFSSQSFSVRTEPNFDNGALHSEHPYINAGGGNELNFDARLRVPINVVEGGLITFDEIVLVEPGEENTSYGDPDFWDYVIVEASEDNGDSWVRLLDGYDSSNNPWWIARYNAGISGQNSTSDAQQEMYEKRVIPLHQPARGIDIGDQVILRWRLFSDPFATGWGWVIDNLEIQKPLNTTPVIELDQANEEVLILGNPILNSQLKFRIEGDLDFSSIRILDMNGRLHFSKQYSEERIDISTLANGAYIILFASEDIWITKPFIKL